MKAVISIIFRYKLQVLGLIVLGAVSCNSQKKTMMNRVMQNVTAHYNILYNAKELINTSDENIKNSHQDNFDQLISVYKEPEEKFSQGEIKNLDNAIFKLNAIVNDKFQSKYVDDAYFLIAKANHLKSNFFNAAEFFTYVYNSYPKESKIKQAALQWKARSLIQLNQLAEAESIIDSALKYKDTEKRSISDIYAVQTQLYIYSRQYPEAIVTLENAIKFSKTKQNRIRWKYLLAQLQDLTGQTEAAYKNYSSVMKSNTSFDMAFNASLNRIRMQGDQEGKKVDKVKKLKALLKDDKNIDFIDQIHFQIGNVYEGKNEVDKAIESYNTAIRKSTRNQTQKGMAYLKLAEIYFKQANFVKSKTYYDSTLTALPQTHPDYKQIGRKANNLELVANRLNVIATEDSLQALAKLPEAEREIKIASLVRNNEEQELNKAAEQAGNNTFSGNENSTATIAKDGKFYFNNSTALSQGFSEFKKRWGNRKLEDNWRRSQRSSADIVNTNLANPDSVITISTNKDSIQKQNSDKFKQSLIKSIPLTEDQLAGSNQRIASALFDIGNYYREEMNDSTQAINTYEDLLKRYPENSNKLPVYYNLYRLYSEKNPEKSKMYRKIILEQFPSSPFAKVILDPNYNQKNDEKENQLSIFYDKTYNLYTAKKYESVIANISRSKTEFEANKLSPQLAYLNSLATGHIQKLPEFEKALKQIITDFPNDKLIVPLVNEHLAYIDSNRKTLEIREFALLEVDSTDRFVEEPVIEYTETTPIITSESQIIIKENEVKMVDVPPVKETEFYNFTDFGEYYYIINVLDPSISLSSSRFGIGQFNRSNFTGAGIKHQLKDVNNQNQLIFVGPFPSKVAMDDYFKTINPLLSQIMKIKADQYNVFYITKPNFDKLTNRQTIDQYIEFFKSY